MCVAGHNGSVRRAGMAIGRRVQHRRKTHATMIRSCILILYVYVVWMGGAGGGVGMVSRVSL